MKLLFSCTFPDVMYDYFDDGTLQQTSKSHSHKVLMLWRYRDGIMQWNDDIRNQWEKDPDPNALIQYQQYINSLVVESKE